MHRTDAVVNGALNGAQAAVGRLAYVKLSRDIDIEKHKLPVEKNYLNIFHDYHDATGFLKTGHGIALNLFLTTLDLAVIDIDGDNDIVRDFVMYCVSSGAIVFKTLRGYHIFVSNTFHDIRSNSVVINYKNKKINCELYRAGDKRIIVLNITSTPRSKLINANFVLDGVFLDVSLERFESMMRNLRAINFNIQEKTQERNVSVKSFFKELIGKQSFTKQDFFDAVKKNAVKGNRNNLFCKAAIFAATHYTRQDLEKLREIMLELYSDEVNYEKKIDNIIKTAIMKAMKVKGNILNKKKNGIEAALEFLKMNNARVYYHEDEVYILIDKYAIPLDYLAAYLVVNSVNITKNDEEKLKKILRADQILDTVSDAIILDNTIVYKNNKLYMRTCDNMICVVSSDSIGKYDSVDNVYLLYKKCRCYNVDDVADIDFVFKAFADYTQINGKVAVSLFLPAALNIAQSAFLVEGPAGAGKTTLSKFLQYIANASATTTTLNNNVRDVVSVLKNQHLVGFDEKIPAEIRFLIKSAITSAEYVSRELFKNKDIIRMRFKNSFIFTQVTLQDLAEDEARRTLVIRLQKRNTNIMSTKIQEFIENNHSKIFAALLRIARDVLKFIDDLDYNSLPSVIKNDKNIDYAVVSYATAVVLGCEAEFIQTYKNCRYASFEKSLSVFAEIIKLKNMSSEFNKKIQNYMTATEIAEELIKNKEIYNLKIDDEDAYNLSRKISKVAESVKESLEQMSYTLETSLMYNKQSKKQVKAYRIIDKKD